MLNFLTIALFQVAGFTTPSTIQHAVAQQQKTVAFQSATKITADGGIGGWGGDVKPKDGGIGGWGGDVTAPQDGGIGGWGGDIDGDGTNATEDGGIGGWGGDIDVDSATDGGIGGWGGDVSA